MLETDTLPYICREPPKTDLTMRYIFVFLLAMGCVLPVSTAQEALEGLWEGTITIGGLESQQGYKFELFLDVIDGRKIKGRSYVYIAKDDILEMDITGWLYNDRSIYFQDVDFIPVEGSNVFPRFNRKYQMIFNRSIWESTLEGYWQEMIHDPFDVKRERGRIALRKKDGKKA